MTPSRRKFVQQCVALGSGALWAPTLSSILRASPDSAGNPQGDDSVCPKSSAPAKTLWALRMGDLKKGPEERLPLSCLQGLVNRGQPQIYLAYDNFDEKWLDWLRERGDVKEVRWIDRKQLLEQFMPIVKNVVITDPDVPGTINIASMLCAVEGWLPVTPQAGAEFEHLKVAMDLRGKWKKNIDAYRWFYDKYGAQMSRRSCANYDPGQFELRDYFVEFKIPMVWVSSPKDAKVSKPASPEEEAQFARELFASLPANIPCMGWWDHGQAGEDGAGENGTTSGIDLASEGGKFEVCTGFDGFAHGVGNLSVHSGTTATFRQKPAPPPPLEDKVYVAFTRTDGDGPNFWRQVYRDLWDQPDHGKVPVGWQLGPTAADLMPDILDYFYQHASPNDVFVNALTGVGYIHEAVYLEKWPQAEREGAWRRYMELSQRYFKRLDLSLLTTFEADKLMPQKTLERFAQLPGLRAIYRNYHRFSDTTMENATTEVNGVPVFRAVCGQGYSLATPAKFQHSVDAVVKEIRKFTPVERPAFLHVSLANWMVDMSALVAIEKALGPDYAAVRADHLPVLYSEARKQR
jgi:hypothetical protein